MHRANVSISATRGDFDSLTRDGFLESPLVIVSERALRDFCEAVFVKLGVPSQDARLVTDVLVTADLRGVESQGVAHMKRYVNGLLSGTMLPQNNVRIDRESDALAVVDGGRSLGQIVGHDCMEIAIRKARRNGVGVVVARNSNHYGIAAYYSMMALQYNLIGISMTNTAPLVVPTFGRKAVLGTNPISATSPASDEKPFVLDMATSVVPRGRLEVYARDGKSIPFGWAIDTTGRVTSDPKGVLDAVAKRSEGGILPLGGQGDETSGHKGYGLSLLVDVLSGLLSGAAFGTHVNADESRPNIGHFFMAIDPSFFRPIDEFRRDMDNLIRQLRNSLKAPGHDRIYVHGERSFARAERNKREGVPIRPKVAESLQKIGAELSIEWHPEKLQPGLIA